MSLTRRTPKGACSFRPPYPLAVQNQFIPDIGALLLTAVNDCRAGKGQVPER